MPHTTKRGIILMNLGSPDSTSTADVKKYLDEFLMDGRVIDYPYIFRLLLVKGLITPFRAAKSAEAYSSIWTKDGSPLVHITYQVQQMLEPMIDAPVEVAMRYGSPDMKTAYDRMVSRFPDVEEVVLLPLYPHYAMSSYETAVVHAETTYRKGNYKFKISVIPPFYNNPEYIDALTDSIRPYIKNDGAHLLFSYHSIPERHIHKSDVTGSHCLKDGCCEPGSHSKAHEFCYRHQCYETTRLVVEELGLKEGSYSVSFQSKLGRSAWLTPATTARMGELPKEGIKKLMVVCPSFVSDCLETLEEVAIREKENFMEAGGEAYEFILCMNTQKKWVDTIKKWFDDGYKGASYA